MRAIARRLAPAVERAEPQPRAVASGRGWRRPAERTHRGPRAAVSGETTPSAGPPLRRRAWGDPEAVRNAWRTEVIPQLSDPNGVLVIDATGVLNNGPHSAGGARP